MLEAETAVFPGESSSIPDTESWAVGDHVHELRQPSVSEPRSRAATRDDGGQASSPAEASSNREEPEPEADSEPASMMAAG